MGFPLLTADMWLEVAFLEVKVEQSELTLKFGDGNAIVSQKKVIFPAYIGKKKITISTFWQWITTFVEQGCHKESYDNCNKMNYVVMLFVCRNCVLIIFIYI